MIFFKKKKLYIYCFLVLLVMFSNGAILHIKEYSSVVYIVFVVAVPLVDTETAQQQVVKFHTFHFSPFHCCLNVLSLKKIFF